MAWGRMLDQRYLRRLRHLGELWFWIEVLEKKPAKKSSGIFWSKSKMSRQIKKCNWPENFPAGPPAPPPARASGSPSSVSSWRCPTWRRDPDLGKAVGSASSRWSAGRWGSSSRSPRPKPRAPESGQNRLQALQLNFLNQSSFSSAVATCLFRVTQEKLKSIALTSQENESFTLTYMGD